MKLGVPLEDQIGCLRRELEVRTRLYPEFVRNGRMDKMTAARELELLRAAIGTLEQLLISHRLDLAQPGRRA